MEDNNSEPPPVKNKTLDKANEIEVIINIEDYAEYNSAMAVKVMLNKVITVAEALKKIANKGGIYLIKSNYVYGENNFDLVLVDIPSGEQRILDKTKTLEEEKLGPRNNTIILRKKKREDFRLNIDIHDYQILNSVKSTKETFWNDQLVGDALHKIARKGKLMIMNEDDYGLFFYGVLMDTDRQLGSFGLKPDDTVTLKKKKDENIQLTVIIEDYIKLNCAWTTSALVSKESLVSEALHRITSKGAVAIPEELEEKYDLVILNTGETLVKTQKLGDFKIKNKDKVILRRSEKNTFGKTVQELKEEDVKLLEKIGQGTFGKVYKGTCFGLDVAVKKLKETPDKEKMAEFKHEIEMLSKYTSPHIVRLYGFIETPKQMCIVMELCARGSLYHVMNSVVYDFGWDRTFKVAIEFVQGMLFLHSQNPPIVHRDFKSLNVLVTDDWKVKLCDFGLSRRMTEEMLQTLKRLRSTPAWSPPELLKEIEFTPQSDVYGIGMTMWEMCYRSIMGKYQRPFAEDKAIIFDYQIVVQAAAGKRPTIPQSTPARFADLIKRCWQELPSDRPKCPEILDELLAMQKHYDANTREWDQTKNPTLH